MIKPFLFSLFLSLVTAELAVRIAGWAPLYPARPSEIGAFAPDALLGWQNAPGRFPLEAPPGSGLRFTRRILADGSVATGPGDALSHGADVALFGCSLLWGFGISDEQTLGWKWREWCDERAAEETSVANYAVAGYGTLQALVRYEEVAKRELSPTLAVYGFIQHHEDRNIASASWVDMLLSNSSAKDLRLTYCEVQAGRCKRVISAAILPDTPVLSWFIGRSAVVDRLVRAVVRRDAKQREADARLVTKELLREFSASARSRHTRFVVLLLDGTPNVLDDYKAFLDREGIDAVLCNPSPEHAPDYWIPENNHPNERLNLAWLKCLRDSGVELCPAKNP